MTVFADLSLSDTKRMRPSRGHQMHSASYLPAFSSCETERNNKPAGEACSSTVGSALSQTVTELFVCRLSGSKVGDHRKGTSFPLTTQQMRLMKTRACAHIQYSQGYYNLSEEQKNWNSSLFIFLPPLCTVLN